MNCCDSAVCVEDRDGGFELLSSLRDFRFYVAGAHGLAPMATTCRHYRGLILIPPFHGFDRILASRHGLTPMATTCRPFRTKKME